MYYLYYLLAALIGYLIGSTPFGYILVKIVHKEDIRKFGSGNIGATNVYRAGYKMLARATLVLDALKALFAIFIVANINNVIPFDNQIIANLIAGFFAIIGHIYSCFLNGKGGKGVSTMIGYLIYINIFMALIGLISWAVCFKFSRYSSLSSIVLALTNVLFAILFLNSIEMLIIFLVSILIIFQHVSNIKRLINKKERKL